MAVEENMIWLGGNLAKTTGNICGSKAEIHLYLISPDLQGVLWGPRIIDSAWESRYTQDLDNAPCPRLVIIGLVMDKNTTIIPPDLKEIIGLATFINPYNTRVIVGESITKIIEEVCLE